MFLDFVDITLHINKRMYMCRRVVTTGPFHIDSLVSWWFLWKLMGFLVPSWVVQSLTAPLCWRTESRL